MEQNAEVEDVVLELVEEEASMNIVVADLVEEDSSAAVGFEEEEDTTAEKEELPVEGTTVAVGEGHSAAVAVAALVKGIRCCHLAEELFTVLVAGSK